MISRNTIHERTRNKRESVLSIFVEFRVISWIAPMVFAFSRDCRKMDTLTSWIMRITTNGYAQSTASR